MENLGLALLVGVVAGIIEWDIYGGFHTMINRPLAAGTIMGLVLGDLPKGLFIGASLEFVYLGSISVGAAIPPDAAAATSIATALAIISNIDKNVAIALAIPVASFAQMLQMFIWTINTGLMHRADKSAVVGDIDGACKWHYVGMVFFFLQGFLPAFLAVLFGAPYVADLVANMPEWITGWLKLAGSMLPAVGFAMLFILMNKPKLTPFFIIGYVLAAAFKGTLISTALIGLAAALIFVNSMDDSSAKRTRRVRE